MRLQYCLAKNKEELKQILKLQKANLPKAIPEEERVKEGFVTVSHKLELLARMNVASPHIIAKHHGKVVGYALSMHPKFGKEIAILRPMFDEIKKIVPEGEKFIIMGQICIAKAYRGQGIFRRLYKTMLREIQPAFNSIITEVDAVNTRSLTAHYAIGFYDLKVYNSGGRKWHLIILK